MPVCLSGGLILGEGSSPLVPPNPTPIPTLPPGAVGGRRRWAGPREQQSLWAAATGEWVQWSPPPAPTPARTTEPRKRRDFLCPPRADPVACRLLCGLRAWPRQAGGNAKGPSRGEWGWGAGGRGGGHQPDRGDGGIGVACLVPPLSLAWASPQHLSVTWYSPCSRESVFWPHLASSRVF